MTNQYISGSLGATFVRHEGMEAKIEALEPRTSGALLFDYSASAHRVNEKAVIQRAVINTDIQMMFLIHCSFLCKALFQWFDVSP
ncbi:hypothetical protein AWM69_17505 [Pseudomonas sp. D1HM]|nr:hypothetical protein [Pseudomonas sp. D1HM]